MGIGVLDVIEMYANTVGDTQTLLPKDPVEATSKCRGGLKRCMSSAASEDSGRPRSPKSPRSHRSERFPGSSSSPSPERSNSKRYHWTATPYTTTSDTEDEEVDRRKRSQSFSSSSSSSLLFSSSRKRESYESRRKRFLRTAEALRHSGLLDITMKTAELLRKNQELQREIENLQKETKSFVVSVLTNPENRTVLDSIRSQAQLYELVVPGSQGIMSVSPSESLPEHAFSNGFPSEVDLILAKGRKGLEDDDDKADIRSLASNDTGNVSSPSPAPTESDGTSSLSEDSDSSEKENFSPPRGQFRYKN